MSLILASIARRLKRLATEMAYLENRTFSDKILRIKNSLFDLEKEFSHIIRKAADYKDSLLQIAYTRSGTLLSDLTAANIEIEEVDAHISGVDKKNLLAIRDSAKKILDAMDNFYKLHLNPKFHEHGLSHTDINNRMYEICKQYRKLLMSKFLK